MTLVASNEELSSSERREQHKYATLIQNPNDKVFLSRLLDESSQIRDNGKLAVRIKELIEKYGIPQFFSASDKLLLKTYQLVGYHFAPIAIPIFKKRLRSDTESVIIHEERPILTKHLQDRTQREVKQNVNLLGEVVVGNTEAQGRYHHYLSALEEKDINYISIKLSGIYAQLHPLNYNQSKVELAELLTTIFRKAMEYPVMNSEGKLESKFINLDMEEYKDAHLTLELFIEVLSKPEFKDLTAGIVIQAYLPDASGIYDKLVTFAKKRVEDGGAPLKMRLVKGANLQMESVVSSLKGWENPVLPSKTEVDANYLHIIDKAFNIENAKALHVGIASHNLFSIGYAHLKSKEMGVEKYVTFEMLEGMANQLWRTIKSMGKQIILYTPVVKDEHFLNAVSYLVRRLDENTGDENFLSYSFGLEPDSKEWNFLFKQFKGAFAIKDSSNKTPPRVQDRGNEKHTTTFSTFANEPDTDFDLKQNFQWAEKIVEKWKAKPTEIIPLFIGDKEVETTNSTKYVDRCQEGYTPYEMAMANSEQVTQMLEVSEKSSWCNTSIEERIAILHKAGNLLAANRGDLIGSMAAVTSKTLTEGDVEVSEAIDFCRFYPLSMQNLLKEQGVEIKAKGTVLVISPWNFPLAIPVGGVVAALAGGNSVILKPATVAAPVMWEACKLLWEAGVPKDALQIVITDGREPLKLLTTSPIVKHTILTGGTDTAQRITAANPSTPLSAETGGKNAIILTAKGDRDKAIMNAVASAFGNAGQKCSACSLLLVEKSVFADPSFRAKLRDAAESMHTGSPWNLTNIVGPMITNENDKLLKVIANVESGTEWLIAPDFLDKDKFILKPTILWGVKPDNVAFHTELFAPLLSVGSIDSLEQGIEYVNNLDYGLTSGLQSLDENEIKLWRDTLVAGNLYINRGITGAIVNRQPFGGMKLSAFGGGIKAGGVNYVSCFVNISDNGTLKADNYKAIYESEFAHPRDINELYGEQNITRYLPLDKMALRVASGDSMEDITLVVKAAKIACTPLVISVGEEFSAIDDIKKLGCTVVESESQFIANIAQYSRVRTCGAEPSMALYEAAAANNLYIANAKVVKNGRFELLHYLKEQSVTYEYHRYGSIAELPKVW
ncbi:MAG: bifunctional proline dehydrogenase/L-glutamate gamma-semialdehyde dehydrogenase [Rikenellaceae bacterium]